MSPTRSRPVPCLLALLILLPMATACEQLGIETPAQTEQKRIAEGKAMGGSCRQAGRALEDCYQINPKAIKAAIFEGWREMDAYMRENKLEEIKPQFPMAPPAPKKKPLDAEAEGKGDSKAEAKLDIKSDAKDSEAPAKTEKH